MDTIVDVISEGEDGASGHIDKSNCDQVLSEVAFNTLSAIALEVEASVVITLISIEESQVNSRLDAGISGCGRSSESGTILNEFGNLDWDDLVGCDTAISEEAEVLESESVSFINFESSREVTDIVSHLTGLSPARDGRCEEESNPFFSKFHFFTQ